MNTQRPTSLLWAASSALVVGFLLARWSAPEASFPGEESDYGSHVSIVYWMATTPHWPPVYSGILGAHAPAAALHRLGLSIPRAMLIVADVGWWLSVAALVRIVWPLGRWARSAGIATIALFSLPVFGTMLRDGFFGPIVANGLYATGIAVLLHAPEKPPLRTLAIGAAWLCAGTLTYPDACMWCFPLLLAVSYRALKPHWWVSAALLVLAVEAVLLWGLLERATAPGGGNLDWTRVLAIVGALGSLLFITKPPSEPDTGTAANLVARRFKVVFSAWAAVAFVVGAYSVQQLGHLEYYARKLLYSLVLLAPILAAILARTRLGRVASGSAIAALAWNVPITLGEPLPVAYARFFAPRSHFDAADETCVKQARAIARRKACKHLLVLPGSKEPGREEAWGQRILRVIAANAYTREYVAEYLNFQALRGRLARSFQLAELLRSNPEGALAQVLAASEGIDCFAVGQELLPRELRGDTCLTVLDAAALPRGPLSAAVLSDRVEGYQDQTSCEHVTGWAWAPDFPELRVTVELLSGTEVVASARASYLRADLPPAGIGDGRHAFDMAIPPALLDGEEHELSVRVAGTNTLLPAGHQHIVCRP